MSCAETTHTCTEMISQAQHGDEQGLQLDSVVLLDYFMQVTYCVK